MAINNKAQDLLGLHESDNDSSIEEELVEREDTRFNIKQLRQKGNNSESEDNDDDDDNEDQDVDKEEDESEHSDHDNEDDGNDDPLAEEATSKKRKKTKLKPMTPAELEELELANKRSGVCYLSRVPPFMTPKRVRSLLSKFAELGKLYLAPEDPKITARRRKYSKNRRVNYTEGWVEFKDKRKAKALAEHLNMRQIGGKRTSQHFHEMWNIKYLPKFKWRHLTEQFAYERRARQERLRAEMAQAARENKAYMLNVDKAKKMEHIQERKRKRGQDINTDGTEARRMFRQRDMVNREGATGQAAKKSLDRVEDPGLKNVLGQVFGQ
ncbi:U3 snoRNP-associated protein Esf2 [Halteromyces radiatus]|uniref:U3 snoRNP-associated protein Esf2 n=1 Tax=Halteromyces radiatus TaxID=101107 RepID=UPI002220707B|nr:U3 snoRNP-associated protein Esf2 [Halteromyces radiatus]KAI8097428.1 U3 snoRNP-associated protein Esf2 [Halteromyces radiatus]